MKPFEIHSEHDPETWLRLWDSKIVDLLLRTKVPTAVSDVFRHTREESS